MKVSVLGLGHMGAPIAERLLGAGHDVAVWNRSAGAAAPFPTVLARAGDAWDHGPAVITMLADDDAVAAVLGPLLDGGREGLTAIDMSTISVDGSASLAARAQASGVAFLRAPVSGNPSVVRAGNLGIVISGAREVYDAHEPLLRDIGPAHFYVGPGERARAVKLGLNLMIGGTAELLAEALVLAERAGIGRAEMLEVIAGSAIGSPFVRYKTDALVADDYTSTFTAAGLRKDLDLALRCAGTPLPATELVRDLVDDCIARGMGDQDMTVLLKSLRGT